MTNDRQRRARTPRYRIFVLLAAVVALIATTAPAATAGGTGTATSADTAGVIAPLPGAYPHDDDLRLNQVQVIGTHNSFHLRPNPAFQAYMDTLLPGLSANWQYQHRPLAEQFEELGIRQIELDVFADPEGEIYSDRKAHQVAGLPADGGIAELHEPGLKVLHVQEVDVESTCWTFVSCLQELEDWSDANPGHLPVMVLVEAKQDPIPDVFSMGFVDPIPFGATELDGIDAEIRSVFDEDRIITPDSVRGEHEGLPEALAQDGWPTLGEVRGKVMFGLDNGGSVHNTYLDGHPSAAGRAMFPSAASMGHPAAAFLKLNDPVGSASHITEAVEAGYMVRTRADADPVPGALPENRPEVRDGALATGAQFVSTDFPEPDPVFDEDYEVVFADGAHVRCNPVTGPDWCRTTDVEDPGRVGIPVPTCDEERFTDVDGSNPFCTSISWLASSGLSEGFQDGTFRPSSAVSRQALAAMLGRHVELPDDEPCESPAPDVGADHLFCREIAWSMETGIVIGYDDGTFGPTVAVSRQVAAAFLVRAFGLPVADSCTGEFTDVDADHRYCAEIEALVAAGVAEGYEDGEFRPAAPVSRQGLAAFLFRLSSR